jgi:hypothetical protein
MGECISNDSLFFKSNYICVCLMDFLNRERERGGTYQVYHL